MERITDPRLPAIKSAYTFAERVRNLHRLVALYVHYLRGNPVVISRKLADWFYWETHTYRGNAPLIEPPFAAFIADHSNREPGQEE